MPNAAINTKPQSVQGNSGNWYGNGTNHANKVQNLTVYYDKAGIEAATAKPTFSRFSDSRYMPQNRGREYRITVWQHIYDRQIFNEMTTIGGNKTYTADFQKLGYLSSRDLATVTDELYGANGKFGTANYTDNGKVLLEGEGPTNKVSVQGLTISTKLEKFGEMLDYTEEVDMFSEDKMQVRYRQELGYSANQLFEDLVQLDMLATQKDIEALEYAANCGVKVLSSVHAYDVEDLKTKPYFDNLIKNKIFKRYIVLSSKNGPGTYQGIYDENMRLMVY